MARPTEPDKRLDLARRGADVLARQGLGISAAELADALGVKRPTLLYHFPTFGHLVETALVDVLGAQALFVVAEVEKHTHPIDRLYAQLRAVHRFHEGKEGRIFFLTQAVASTGGARVAEILERANAVFESFRRAAADRVRAGIREGHVVPCDADALVSTVRALVDGLMIQRVTSGLALAPAHDFVWEHLLSPLKVVHPRSAPPPAPSAVERSPTRAPARASARTRTPSPPLGKRVKRVPRKSKKS
jgi:AcrR family transcriptional regulator